MGTLSRAVIVVVYHAIASTRTRVSVPAEQLTADLEALGEAGYTFLSIDEVAYGHELGTGIPDRAAAVTFDDGYRSVLERGLPVLERLRVPAAVFAIAGRLGGDNRWPGQGRAIPTMPLLAAGELHALAEAGVTIGSHSLSHPRLTGVSADAARREIEESARRLEDAVRRPVRHFAYPYGARGDREGALVCGRYRAAWNSESRLLCPGDDRFDLPRLDAHDLHVAARLGWLARDLLPRYLAARRAVRRVRRIAERIGGW